MKTEEKKRLHLVLIRCGIILGAGLSYALFIRLSGWGLPCVFYQATDLQCPGCGMTRMFMALLRLDFAEAAGYNLLAFCMLPFVALLVTCKTVKFIKKGSWDMGSPERIFYHITLVLCIGFFILRNFTNVL